MPTTVPFWSKQQARMDSVPPSTAISRGLEGREGEVLVLAEDNEVDARTEHERRNTNGRFRIDSNIIRLSMRVAKQEKGRMSGLLCCPFHHVSTTHSDEFEHLKIKRTQVEVCFRDSIGGLDSKQVSQFKKR